MEKYPDRELRPECDLDYRKSRPNHLAPRMGETRIMVVLDPDVAKVFTSSEAVNEALRGVDSDEAQGRAITPWNQ